MTSTQTYRPAVGDSVILDDDRYPGQVFTVERIKVSKALVQPANAAARNRWPREVNVPLTMLAKFTGEDPEKAPLIDPDRLLAQLEAKIRFEQGVLVRLVRPSDRYTAEQLFVVTANNEKSVSIVKIGGDGGRYLRVPHSGLTIVDPADVLR